MAKVATKKKIETTVRQYLRRHGKTRLRLKPNNQILHKLYRAVGIPESALHELCSHYHGWTGHSYSFFADLAHASVMKGKLTTPLHRAMYVDHLVTRAYLKQEKITLYRGVFGDYAYRLSEKAKRARKHVMVPIRGCDSWTDKRQTAHCFGHVVLKVTVRREQVVACHVSNPVLKDMGENEYVVTYPGKRIRVSKKDIVVNREGGW